MNYLFILSGQCKVGGMGMMEGEREGEEREREREGERVSPGVNLTPSDSQCSESSSKTKRVRLFATQK